MLKYIALSKPPNLLGLHVSRFFSNLSWVTWPKLKLYGSTPKRRAFKVFPSTGTIDLEQNGMLMNVKNGDRVTIESQNVHMTIFWIMTNIVLTLETKIPGSCTRAWCGFIVYWLCLRSFNTCPAKYRSQQHQQSRLMSAITTTSEMSGVTGMVRIQCVKRWVFASHNTLKSGKSLCRHLLHIIIEAKPQWKEKKIHIVHVVNLSSYKFRSVTHFLQKSFLPKGYSTAM